MCVCQQDVKADFSHFTSQCWRWCTQIAVN